MNVRSILNRLPERLATGAYILHSGIEKWHGSAEQAAGLHGMAAGAYPFLKDIQPTTFLKLLSVGEMTTGALLLIPFVPQALAGVALSTFSGGLVTMYLRTPALHKPGSVWPTQNGTAISKDIWMFAIGSGLVLDKLLEH
jgi:uncharacterized membrane protein YphA (DoxX/SURF4 family)